MPAKSRKWWKRGVIAHSQRLRCYSICTRWVDDWLLGIEERQAKAVSWKCHRVIIVHTEWTLWMSSQQNENVSHSCGISGSCSSYHMHYVCVQEKMVHFICGHNVGLCKCRPIFKILSLTYSQGNCLCTGHRGWIWKIKTTAKLILLPEKMYKPICFTRNSAKTKLAVYVP